MSKWEIFNFCLKTSILYNEIVKQAKMFHLSFMTYEYRIKLKLKLNFVSALIAIKFFK